MKTVILAGGKGLRYDSDIPKPLATIGNKSILEHVMDIYRNQGYNDFVLCLGYKKEKIIERFDNIKHNYNIEFVDTGEESNTGERIRLIKDYIPKDDEHFFCTYSDGLANINLELLCKQHKILNSIATLTAVKPQNVYGIINIGFNGKVTKFNEKPRMQDYINGGFFIFRRNIFDYIINDNEDLEIDILPRLTTTWKLGALKHERFWATMNTIKDQVKLNELYNEYNMYHKELPWLASSTKTINNNR